MSRTEDQDWTSNASLECIYPRNLCLRSSGGIPTFRRCKIPFFILGFASTQTPPRPTNGVFSPYWAATLKSSQRKKIPRTQPLDIKRYSSLKSLILTYHLDGIDVDYEKFPENSNSSFAYCIGQLITLLKNQSLVSVATIAPFYNTVSPYVELYERYVDVVDYVNYQFYTDKVKSPEAYLEAFRNRTEQFDRGKVLPSYEVNGRGIQGDAFFEALRLLEDDGFDVNGAMIFSADASASNGYYYEIKTQEFLLSNSTS
ncbi:UNVERIFIED_CONTAM: Chitinase 1 [Sesamum angustifolium]|uniref:Chitinase 1 n=1 Tax=Sesamum angustifolium TaxID=2727405 RepID=A0AAW2NIQ1_9LAMI